jgi:hypothetical protein
VTRALALAALLSLAAAPAAAGESACWFENNVLVVPAEVAGVAGDYILDTATPQTVLADTQAQAAGHDGTSLTAEVRLAGLRLTDRAVAVAGLDLRTGALPTPVAGVIGADVLKGFVLDVSFRPCRVGLSRPGGAPRFGRAQRLPIAWIAGRPTVRAGAADGPRAILAPFAPATGGDTAVRLSDSLAAAPGAAKPKELYPYGVLRPRLRALSFAGTLWQDLPAGLLKAEDPALAGEIGTPLLAAWRLRFDFPRGELLLAPNEKGPGKRRGPHRSPAPRR